MKKDIENRTDIDRLVQLFYNKITNNSEISDFFGKVVPIDWEKHLPIMSGFWDFILFSTPNAYLGNVMNPHFHVNALKKIEPKHFEIWLNLFNQSVDELFEGTKAEDAKNAAFNIGSTLKYKLKKENEQPIERKQ
ncbi:MAG: group III truncated hemoglobin [Cytophagales bacterium]